MTRTGWLVLLVIIIVAVGGFLWWNSSKAPMADQSASGSNPTLNNIADQTGAAPDATTPPTPTTSNAATSGTTAPSSSAVAPMSATVTYDGSSFSPSSVTVAQGGIVTFTDTSGQMWVASDPHPAHTGYDGTSRTEHCAAGYAGVAPFDECAPGSTFTFTFNKVGSWGYHDHLNHGATGTIVVVASDASTSTQ